MGTFADSLFTVLMSWVRALVSGIWALFTSDHTTVLEFFGKNWLAIAAVIVAAGLVIDWIIWLLRWQPYHLWAQKARRLLRMEEPEEEVHTTTRAHAAVMPSKKPVFTPAQLDQTMEIEPYEHEAAEAFEEEDDMVLQAQSAPDEYAYPGMRYDSEAKEEIGSTQRYGAVTQEGPGAAEVARRRDEIEAWQLQMQEEARARAEAERAQREAQAAYEAEQARLAREAYEAEQARLAQEAYEADQARLAQEEYERQLAEYERQKAQYERDLAEYERQKAEYEAQLAREAMMQEQAQEIAPQQEMASSARRRRTAQKTYSDYIGGQTVEELPDAPVWPQMADDMHLAQEQTIKHSRLLDRMAKMMEPEDEQLTQLTKLPPRVNMQDAYKPAAEPRKPGRRSRNS